MSHYLNRNLLYYVIEIYKLIFSFTMSRSKVTISHNTRIVFKQNDEIIKNLIHEKINEVLER